MLPGSIEILDVGQCRYAITDGAFVAVETSLELRARVQAIGNALFAQVDGFFVTEAQGRGAGGFGLW